MSNSKFRAIDLYSGVGGWSLGLRLSGIEVVASYEHWGAANETNFKNNSHQAQTVDIRRLALSDLPEDIDIVVGSPPCTQFSFSNRGGGGDIDDGLKDIAKFLSVVDYLKPRFWAMENVPRVAKILTSELLPGGRLARFAHLNCRTHVVDMAQYGVPQRRRRCIAGSFDFELLESYRESRTPLTLGKVIESLSSDPVRDPLFGTSISKDALTDHFEEAPLSEEEVRINRANKTTHTVYNAMPFPDEVHRPVRTITATCTRVSRESVVIPGVRPESFRRLTLRERASLQGFPITFQFYGSSYSQKLKMIGNAIPPAFSFLIGHAMQASSSTDVPQFSALAGSLSRPEPSPIETQPERQGSRFPANRAFRFAVPSLRLKSGVRFELTNDFESGVCTWRTDFYFGTSKKIKRIDLNDSLTKAMRAAMGQKTRAVDQIIRGCLAQEFQTVDLVNMQNVWAHRGPGGTRPFMVLDLLDRIGRETCSELAGSDVESEVLIDEALRFQFGEAACDLPGVNKLRRNAPLIAAGLLVGSHANSLMSAGKRGGRRALG